MSLNLKNMANKKSEEKFLSIESRKVSLAPYLFYVVKLAKALFSSNDSISHRYYIARYQKITEDDMQAALDSLL